MKAVVDESADQRGTGDQPGEDRGAGPAVGVGADQPVDDAEEAAADQEGARDVEPGVRGVRLRQTQPGQRQQNQADRHVQPEDPLPGEVLGEAAADQGPAGDGKSGDGAEDAERHAAAGGGHGGREQGERQRHHDRRTDPLDGPEGDQLIDPGRQGRGGGGAGEDGEPGEEEPPPAEPVTEGRTEHQQHGEGQGVRVHRPFELRQFAAEALADGGQGGGDDKIVERGHEAGDAGDDEGPDRS